jgi:hypothetical protein
MKNNQWFLLGIIFLLGSALGYLLGSNKETSPATHDSNIAAKPSSKRTSSSSSSIHSRLNRENRSGGTHETSLAKPDPQQLILQTDGSFIVPKEETHRIKVRICGDDGELLLDECKKIGLKETQIKDLLELHNQHLEREKKRQSDEATILCQKGNFRAIYVPPNTQIDAWSQEYNEQAARILTDHVSMTMPKLSESLGYINAPTEMERVILLVDNGSKTRNYSIIGYSNPIDVELFQNAQDPEVFQKGAYSIRNIFSSQTPEILRHIFKD